MSQKSYLEPIAEAVRAGERTALAYVEEALTKAEAVEDYNALISLTAERAKDRAKAIDEKVKHGEETGALAGVPFVVKDNFLTFGGKTTAASNMLKNFDAPYQATAIEKLEAAGAICIGKANLDAFGHGGSTEHSDFGPTLNPVDKARVPGGSSGGSGAAVALDITPLALGTDTGGSIRLPASFCGTVGLKPTYGLVSRWGVISMASSTDVIGPLTKTAYDAALVLDIMAGQDGRDATLAKRDDSYLPVKPQKPAKLRIGVIKEHMPDNLHAPTKQVIDEQLKRLRELGHTIEEVSLPLAADIALAIYYIVMPAELSSNLARYDGVKYGHSSAGAKTLQETYSASRTEGFNDENTRRIMIGTYVLESGYFDAYYRKAQTVRTLLIKQFEEAFKTYDILIGPTAPGPAFKLGERTKDPLSMYLADIMTVSSNLTGMPAISMPIGNAVVDDAAVGGLPVGLQLLAPYGQDKFLLEVACQLEEARA